MSYQFSISGHSDASAEEVKDAARKAYSEMSFGAGASYGNLSGHTASGEEFGLILPEAVSEANAAPAEVPSAETAEDASVDQASDGSGNATDEA